ncbi:MAG: hypothetical protein ABTQ29_12240 [Siculibacillus sp.]
MSNVIDLHAQGTNLSQTSPSSLYSAARHGLFDTAFVGMGGGRMLVRIAHGDRRPDAPRFMLSAPILRTRLNDGFDPRRTAEGHPGAPDVSAARAYDVPEGTFETAALLAVVGSDDLGAFGAALMALGAQLVAEAGRRKAAPGV